MTEGQYLDNAVSLLREIVAIPSHSREEGKRADFICSYLKDKNLDFERKNHNIIITKKDNRGNRPHLLLNTHIDTIVESDRYTFDPFHSPVSDEKVYGLGSNDAGGSIVSLLEAFIYFNERELPFDLSLIYTAEEECSGPKGMESLENMISQRFDFAIIGEPTAMRGAIAERGLLVIDATAKGVAGHAARNEGVNAIDIAMEDISKFKSYKFEKKSQSMGDIKLSVTMINAGTQHNVIPDTCKWVTDIRTTDQYTNAELLTLLQKEVTSELKARSLTNKSSATPDGHILIKAIDLCGIDKYVSPTTSDWMRLSIPAIKIGPGDSSRSHKADEFINISEIDEGIDKYIRIIEKLAELISNGK